MSGRPELPGLPPPAGHGELPAPGGAGSCGFPSGRWPDRDRADVGIPRRHARAVPAAAGTGAGARGRSGPLTGCLGGVTGPGGDRADVSRGRLQPAPGPLPARKLVRPARAELEPGVPLSVHPRLGGGGEGANSGDQERSGSSAGRVPPAGLGSASSGMWRLREVTEQRCLCPFPCNRNGSRRPLSRRRSLGSLSVDQVPRDEVCLRRGPGSAGAEPRATAAAGNVSGLWLLRGGRSCRGQLRRWGRRASSSGAVTPGRPRAAPGSAAALRGAGLAGLVPAAGCAAPRSAAEERFSAAASPGQGFSPGEAGEHCTGNCRGLCYSTASIITDLARF